MKRIFFALSMALTLPAQAQFDEEYAPPPPPLPEARVQLEVLPLELLLGGFSGHLLFPITNNLAIGPSLSYLDRQLEHEIVVDGLGYGLRVDYSFAEMLFEEGWYAGGLLNVVSMDFSARDPLLGRATDDVNVINLGVGAGYQWYWDTFGLRLGALLAASTENDITIDFSNGDEKTVKLPGVGAGVELLVGFRF